jgi:hypothetical protein
LTEYFLTLEANYRKDNFLLITPDPDLPFGINLFEVNNPSDPIEVERTVDVTLQIFKSFWVMKCYTGLFGRSHTECSVTI